MFAAVSGEEQGLLGSSHLLEWAKQQGYTVGGMFTDDIVGADTAPGGPHRVRVDSFDLVRRDSPTFIPAALRGVWIAGRACGGACGLGFARLCA